MDGLRCGYKTTTTYISFFSNLALASLPPNSASGSSSTETITSVVADSFFSEWFIVIREGNKQSAALLLEKYMYPRDNHPLELI